MPDEIYVVDTATREPVKLGPVSFYDIGIKERADLERWVAKDPGLLGERLLVVTSEFNRFDKSRRRLDVLALDTNGSLVIIELKLDASRSLADQQAIRYAALCSSMTMDDVAEELAEFENCSREEALEKIRTFLGVEELPELGTRPRIILAAGSMNDEELTSCVLWLRGFQVDISCVELTPYCIPDSSQVIVVPRTVIPTPDRAQHYLVRIDKRKSRRGSGICDKLARAEFWRAVAHEFNGLDTVFRASGRATGTHMCVRVGCKGVHYEWIVRGRERRLDVALHFEFDDRDESFRWLGLIEPHGSSISEGMGLEFDLVPWGQRWAEARFRLLFKGSFPGRVAAPRAAEVMRGLVERTWPLIEDHVAERRCTARKELSAVSEKLLAAAQRLESHIAAPDDL